MSGTGSARGTRVNSLDWLRVLALLGVFVYHTLRPFDTTYWHVKSVHRSQLLTDVLAVIGSWGLAFFFLIAGASTFLALRWRTPVEYVRERLLRLAVPLAVGWAGARPGAAVAGGAPSPHLERLLG
jgi:glucan biosynthesis protein C